ncbi:MAG: peptide chain release factor 2 [Candidatus Moranbacteria bacterium]|nr:peptide chain release factor 2 [Candidatus Moranbacteria bacterium]MDX9855479.1 peptide chain release factor 2 [Candidatus Moranbacteria bacterium]
MCKNRKIRLKYSKIKSRSCGTVFDFEQKKQKMKELEDEAQQPDFWKDQKVASLKMRELENLKEVVEKLENLEKKIGYLEEISEIAESPKEKKEIKEQVDSAEKESDRLEVDTLLGGKYDQSDAILSIHAGAGGVDAQDWAEMLLRMYMRWAEEKKFKLKILDESRGGEAGIKSATIEISGPYAYGYLKGEAGTHRLVRLSPFNSDNLRQTSFALAEVLPVIKDSEGENVNEKDLKIDTFRSSGAGGQSVNTTDSAVRITHIPTGIVVTCQNERSQLQNREKALEILNSKLRQKQEEERQKEKKELRGEYRSAEWGNQIRSYVLHPYKLVKDHRTEYEESDAEKVLGGKLDGFIRAYLEK